MSTSPHCSPVAELAADRGGVLYVGEDQDCCWHQELWVWLMWAPFWSVDDGWSCSTGATQPHSSSRSHIHTRSLFFWKGEGGGGELEGGREGGERTGGVEESAAWRVLLIQPAWLFFSFLFLLCLLCLLLQSQVKHSSGLEGDQWASLLSLFHLFVSTLLCISERPLHLYALSFLPPLSLLSQLLSAHSCMSSLLLLFSISLFVSLSPTYLVLSLLIFPAQPLFVFLCPLFSLFLPLLRRCLRLSLAFSSSAVSPFFFLSLIGQSWRYFIFLSQTNTTKRPTPVVLWARRRDLHVTFKNSRLPEVTSISRV